MSREKGFSTLSVHGGERRSKAEHSVTQPVYLTSTYTFADTQALVDYMEGEVEREEYGRYGNPTQRAAEEKLATLEGAESALLCASGMAAITGALLPMLSRGAHVVATSDSYRRTRQFLTKFLVRYDVVVTVVPPGDYDALAAAMTDRTRVVLSESPTNPYLNVVDLPRVVEIAHARRAKVVIDSTFATPYNQRPLEMGVDLVVHSATKYLGGHNDLLGGVVAGSGPLVSAIREAQSMLGAIPDPHMCYLLMRGLKTFGLRMARQNENGQAIADFLSRHPRVSKTYYPGLSEHPHHQVAAAQMRGFGGVVSFELDADGPATSRFVDALEIPYIAPSLGGVESLVEQPALMSYYELAPEDRLALGIPDSLVRYAAGIEDADDLVADLRQALERSE